MTDWNLFSFQKFVRDSFPQFERSLNDQQDGRDASSVCIDASEIAFSLFIQTLLGQSSIHRLDQWLRSTMADDLFDRGPSDDSGSDSTILDAADGWNRGDIRRAACQMIASLQRQGHLTMTLPGGSTVRPAALDGSCFGGHWFSVLTLPGDSVQTPLDLEPYNTMGDERTASFALLHRLKQSESEVPFSHLLLDGLYMNRSMLFRGHDMGFYPVIKTTDEDLTCVQTLNEQWDCYQSGEPLNDETRVIHGEDPCRGYNYEALQSTDLTWNGIALNGLRITTVYESGPHQGRSETYWVFTTDPTLSARALRQLAHHRWAIETNEFKELNQLVGSKSGFVQSPEKKFTLLFWQMIGWALFQAFRGHCDFVLQSMKHGYVITKKWLIERLKEHTYRAMANGPPVVE